MKCEDKTVKLTQVSLAFIFIYDLHDFQTERRISEVRISPPPGEQISQMPHWYPRANPHPMLCLPPPVLH